VTSPPSSRSAALIGGAIVYRAEHGGRELTALQVRQILFRWALTIAALGALVSLITELLRRFLRPAATATFSLATTRPGAADAPAQALSSPRKSRTRQ